MNDWQRNKREKKREKKEEKLLDRWGKGGGMLVEKSVGKHDQAN